MRIYLDNCALNRPFDDQSQPRIKLETEAVIEIRRRITFGRIGLAWSYMNDFEASQNPFEDVRASAFEWKTIAEVLVPPSISIVRTAYELREAGVKPLDSLHVAAASHADCDYFISTDDGILSKVKTFRKLLISTPSAFIEGIK